MLNIIPIPAFTDNYIWLLTDGNYGVIVDPGEASMVMEALKKHAIRPIAILITHHHHDHTNGVMDLIHHFQVPSYGPTHDDIPSITNKLQANQVINFPELAVTFTILAIPGHTRGHIAYYGHDILFCGDTLFTGGCGRIFEGTATQMYASLAILKNLSATTQIYCGHEYTQANLRFARQVEPENPHLLQRIAETDQKRAQGLPTVPSTLALEQLTNPFLRCDVPQVKQAAERVAGKSLADPVEVFAVLREWKNIQS